MDIIYSPLSSLYGDELHDFLLGVNGMNGANLFNVMFAVLAIISMVLVPGWYYKLWDRATWAPISKWLLVLVANMLIVLIVNIVWVELLSGNMQDGDGTSLPIGFTNILGFGIASAIISVATFFIASMGWKTVSTNCPNTPF